MRLGGPYGNLGTRGFGQTDLPGWSAEPVINFWSEEQFGVPGTHEFIGVVTGAESVSHRIQYNIGDYRNRVAALMMAKKEGYRAPNGAEVSGETLMGLMLEGGRAAGAGLRTDNESLAVQM